MTNIHDIYRWYQDIDIEKIDIYELLNENENLGQLYYRLKDQFNSISDYCNQQFELYLSGKISNDISLNILKKHNRLQDNILQIFVSRNNDGIQLEKEGKIELAIKFYENNITDGFFGTHPYERLAIIYHKQKEFEKEIRVIEAFIKMGKLFLNVSYSSIISKFENRLAKARELKNKMIKT